MSYTKGEKHLNNVCIMQKHMDSERVLERRKEFDISEAYIVNAVNFYSDLLKACKTVLSWIDNPKSIDCDDSRLYDMLQQAINKAERGVK